MDRRLLFKVAGRWLPQGVSPGRAWLAACFNLGLGATAAGLLIATAPAWGWGDPVLYGALAALSACAYLSEARLKSQAREGFAEAGTFFNAGIALALVALVLVGPLPALLVWWIPDAISRIILRREPIASPGHVATLTGSIAALIAGGAILAGLADLDVATMPAVALAGAAMYVVDFAFVSLAFDPFYGGQRPRALIRSEFFAALPAFLLALPLAMLAIALAPSLGVAALVPLGMAAMVPQFALAALVDARSIRRLSPERASAVYAAALADVLQMPSRQRAALLNAVQLHAPSPASSLRGVSAQLSEWISHLASRDLVSLEATLIALRADERFDGRDWPDGLAALEPSPLASRILAVARRWAELTAAGTAELPHHTALLALAVDSGGRLDPTVVSAAAQVVAEEEAFIRDPAAEPRLHRIPLSRGLSRRLLGSALIGRAAT